MKKESTSLKQEKLFISSNTSIFYNEKAACIV